MRRVRTGISHIKPFIFTNICSRVLIKRDRNNISQKQESTTFNQGEDISAGKDNSRPGIKNINFFSGIKGSEAETTVSSSTPMPTK
jgi:hypothetical protein